ncbi:peptidase M4 [Bacillaceae bacterium W0354]
MKWYKLIAPAAIGITVGTLLAKKVKKHLNLPEEALERAKAIFKNGVISGSWIVMEKETINKDGEELSVYKGGITHLVDGKSYEYRFISDALNGELIEMNLLNQSEQDKPL